MQCVCPWLPEEPHTLQKSQEGISTLLSQASHYPLPSYPRRITQTPPARWVASANTPSLAALSPSISLPLRRESDTYSTHLPFRNSKRWIPQQLWYLDLRNLPCLTSLRSSLSKPPSDVLVVQGLTLCLLPLVCGPRGPSSRSAELPDH